MRPPFLQEVRIPPGVPENSLQRVVGEAHALRRRRRPQRARGGGAVELADLHEGEKPLRVGLRLPDLARQLRQAGADERDREAPLLAPVQGGDQRREIAARDVLQLVDEQYDRAVPPCRRFADDAQQVRQVGFEIARVRQAGLRTRVDAQFDLPGLHPGRGDEAGQPAPGAAHMFLCRLPPVEREQRLVQLRREQGWQGSPLRGLEPDADDAARLGFVGDSVEKHRLAHAAQAGEEDVLLAPPRLHAVHGHRGGLERVVAPRQFRRRAAGARRVGVRSRVHL